MAIDLYTLLMDPEAADAETKAQAMTAALRKQQSLGLLGALTGDKVLGNVGGQLMAQAGEGQARIGDAAKVRLQRALQKEEAAALNAHRQAQLGHDANQLAETTRHHKALEALQRMEALRRQKEESDKAKSIPAGEVVKLAELKGASGALDDLYSSFEGDVAKGFGSSLTGLTQFVPGTDASKYTDKQKAAAQTIGTILEGGKLTDPDFQKYMALVPDASDSKARAKAKRDTLQQMIARKQSSALTGLQQAGYDTGTLETMKGPDKKAERTATGRGKSKSGKAIVYYSDGTAEYE